MVSKKHAKATASKISSTADLAASSNTQVAKKSSLLLSAFSPSRYELHWFASVIQVFDSQHLRIHDSATGRLCCDHAITSKAAITCLHWGSLGKGPSGKEVPSKKRKRDSLVNGLGREKGTDVVLAYGTSDSEIKFYSPAKAAIVGALEGVHTQGIKVFRFSSRDGKPAQGWSVGGDGKLVQWDIQKGTTIRSFTIPGPTPSALCPLESAILYASHTAYLLELDQDRTTPFTASVRPVHSIISSASNLSHSLSFATAASSDRHVTVFNKNSGGSVGDLRTEDDVVSIALYTKAPPVQESDDTQDISRPQQVLLVVNREGALEIFPSPFAFGNSAGRPPSDLLKTRMKQRTRKAAAVIKIIRPDKTSTPVPILDASFQGNEIVMAWTEGGVNLVFDRLKFLDEEDGNLLVDGLTEIVKVKSGSSIGAVEMNGVKDMGKSHVDESHAVVVNGGDRADRVGSADEQEVVDFSSGEEESESEGGSLAEEEIAEQAVADEDVRMQGVSENEEPAETGTRKEPFTVADLALVTETLEEAEEPSFGDLIRANAPEPIDVQATFRDPHEQAVVPNPEGAANLPSGMSLGTVLTQSLRTNDVNLLETCFHVKSIPTVRATIERLDSALATALLQKLAERLHSRPGRAGSLMIWIQWTLVAHGGYIASQPEVMKQLASLYRVVQERANSLQPLLALKGKLDMLEAQLTLRKRLQARFKARNAIDEENDDRIIYVEGQDESDMEDEAAYINSPRQALTGPAVDGGDHESSGESANEDDEDEEDGEDDLLVTANGVEPETSSEGSDSDEDEVIDGRTSSSGPDSDDEGSFDGINHDTSDSNASSPPLSPSRKESGIAKLSNGVGSRNRRKTRG